MTRFLVRLALPFLTLFTFTIGLIRARPYDDHGLRDLLLPPDCPAPCFMGIRPGVTTVEEIVMTLETHGWVGEILNIACSTFDLSTTSLACDLGWYWSGEQPAWIDPQFPGYVRVMSESPLMTFISVPIKTIRLGDMLLTLGAPDHQGAIIDTLDLFIYTASYEQFHLLFGVSGNCPVGNLLHYDLYYIQFREDLSDFRPEQSWRDVIRAKAC